MKEVQLNDVAKFIRGITFKPNDKVKPFSDGSVVCYRTKNIQTKLDQFDLIAVPTRFVKRQEQFIKPGDILISTANSWQLVGKCCWVPKLDYIATLGGFISLIRANDDLIDAKYLYYWLNLPHTQLGLRYCGRQTTNISNMDIKRALKLKIPLPSRPQQRRIAAMLDKADELRAKRKTGLDKLDTLLESIFLDMFGDPVTNPKGWAVGTIGDLAAHVNYGTSKKAGQEGKYPILRMGNITYKGNWDFSSMKYIDLEDKELSKHLVHQGQVLFNRTNSKKLVGKTAVYREIEPMAFAGYLIRVIANDKADPEYIAGFMNSAYAKTYLREKCKSIVGMANINARELQAIKLPIPPIGLQRKYGQVIKKVEEERKRYIKNLAVLDNLFHSLQQRAFRGGR